MELSQPLQQDQTTKKKISSPCVQVCRLQEGVCTGCGRTKNQIKEWTSYTEFKRIKIMETLRGTTTT